VTADWLLAALSLTASWLMGSKRRGAWLVAILTNVVGMAYFAGTGQDGLVALEAAFILTNTRGWLRWNGTRPPDVAQALADVLEHHAPPGATRTLAHTADARHARRGHPSGIPRQEAR
jgi:hypothetical protein